MPSWPPNTHQDVYDELNDSLGWASSLIQRLQIAEGYGHMGLLWIAGRYYGSGQYSTNSPATAASTRMYLTPFYLARSRSIDRIAINVTIAGASGSLTRLGVYNADPDTGLPTTVLVDGGGPLTSDTTGIKESTISASINGLKWLACITQSTGVPTVTALNNSMMPNIAGYTLPSSPQANCGVTTDLINPSNPLPDVTSATWAYNAGSFPAISVRAA